MQGGVRKETYMHSLLCCLSLRNFISLRRKLRGFPCENYMKKFKHPTNPPVTKANRFQPAWNIFDE